MVWQALQGQRCHTRSSALIRLHRQPEWTESNRQRLLSNANQYQVALNINSVPTIWKGTQWDPTIWGNVSALLRQVSTKELSSSVTRAERLVKFEESSQEKASLNNRKRFDSFNKLLGLPGEPMVPAKQGQVGVASSTPVAQERCTDDVLRCARDEAWTMATRQSMHTIARYRTQASHSLPRLNVISLEGF